MLLTCKRVPMGHRAQSELWREILGWDRELDEPQLESVTIVLCKDTCSWAISGQDFQTMTVTPSIDASGSGHWHGFIRDGLIV